MGGHTELTESEKLHNSLNGHFAVCREKGASPDSCPAWAVESGWLVQEEFSDCGWEGCTVARSHPPTHPA